MEKIKNILIVAGEASSDLHASHLVQAIKEINPSTQFSGLGGKRLKEQGVNLYFDLVELAVVGFWEVLKHLKKFKQIFADLLVKVDLNPPDLAILVDYPGFNLRLAKELKKRKIPIVYYISPQVWAWGRGRLNLIRKFVDRMIVLFEFEKELYKKEGIPVSFVGHPLLDLVKPTLNKEELLPKLNIPVTKYSVALLPGSREKEVKNILPIMLDTARLMHNDIPDIKFLILRASTVRQDLFRQILSRYKLPVYILNDLTYDGLAASDFAIVASGTATLETALLGIPMVIIYKVSFSTWLYLRMAIKVPYIGMVNIIANRYIVPEFVQYNAKPRKIYSYIKDTLTDPGKLDRIKPLLHDVKLRLGQTQATKKAARIIVELLENYAHKSR
ncbi:MAG: lipid-A-disaccharide synthase [Omnitrophica WOR_2 bacterium RIFCSPLOWO2_01_FULL_41_12]|nr:MAG: lipid-A-disaccharide synthase [Omnitrophica WOR_2 bacterium RIFCSPLOWO2_01_FULL_41_12]